MAGIQRNSLSLFALAFVCYCFILIAPAVTGNMEGMKSDPREYSTNNGGAGNTPLSGKGATGNFPGSKRNLRSIYGLGPKMLQIARSKIPIELDLLVENDDGDRLKRFDDYGHMRFGKRGGEEQFDDYGHMRFGRST